MNRKDRSLGLVALTGVLVFAGAGLFAGLERASAGGGTDAPVSSILDPGEAGPAGDTLAVARGRELFRSLGCAGCHGAEGVGRNRLLLDSVGAHVSADTLRLWIVDPQAVQPSVRKPSYDDLEEREVDDLVAYMMSLKGRGS